MKEKRDYEAKAAYMKAWYEKTKEARRAYAKEHYQKNKEAKLAKAAEWRRANPEKQKELSKKYSAAHSERRKAAQAQKREFVKQAKDVPCTDCGVKYPYYVMDFDHRDPDDKVFGLSAKARFKSLSSIEAEIAKCDVVCANCHRERTHRRKQ